MSESPATTPRPRAADDFAAIGARLAALKAGCTCILYRDGDGRVRAAETMPNCVLHGLGATAAWPVDPCAPVVAAIAALDAAYRVEAERGVALAVWRGLAPRLALALPWRPIDPAG
jgi:hypothetical protein